MPQSPIPSIIQRILNFSLILIFLSAFIVVIIGAATANIRQEVKSLNAFLEGAETLQENFESSLSMYTDEPRRIIDFVLSLRPETEMEYIGFIAAIEDIGIDLDLNLDLQSIDGSESNVAESVLGYDVEFYGSEDNLIDFLSEVEHMPYYIRVELINYKSLALLNEDSLPNINLKLYLYVKEN